MVPALRRWWRRLLLGAVAALTVSVVHAQSSSCSGLGGTGLTDNGLVSTGNSLQFGNNSTINTNTISGTGNATTTSGPMTNETASLPPLEPANFPSFSGSNVSVGSGGLSEGTYGTVTVSGSTTRVFSGGTYYMSSLSITGNNTTAQLAPGTYFVNSLIMDNQTRITISPAGVVRIYVGNVFQAGNQTSINGGGTASNMQILLYSGADMQVGNASSGSSNIDFSGLIYAPSTTSSIQFGNNNDFQGSVIAAGSVQMGNNTDVTYTSSDQAAVAAISTCTPPPTLRGEYRFDECSWTSGAANAVTDSSGNGYHGTPYGATLATGRVNNGADLSATGTSDYLQLSDSLLNGRTDVSVSLWFKTSVSKSWQQILHALGTSGTTYDSVALYLVNSTGLVAKIRNSTLSATAPSSVTDGAWHHVAIVRQAAQGCIYLDGSSLGCTANSNGTLPVQSGSTLIGQEQDSYGGGFSSAEALEGMIDEVKFYSGALGASLISQIYTNEGAGLNYDGSTRSNPCQPLDHIRIEHATGNGVTCTPSTLTIKACADASCSTLYTTGAVTGTLTATGTPTINWVGGSGFTIASGSGSVSKEVQVTTAGTVDFGVQSGSVSPSPTSAASCNFGSPSCRFTAADSGFLVNVSDHVAEVSQSISISAVKKDNNSLECTPAFASVSKNVTFTCSYQNPASGYVPVRLGGTALNVANNAASACDGTGQSLSLSFNASGVATTTLQYADVGQLGLTASYAGTSGAETGLVMTGTDSFVAKPADFTISGVSETLASSRPSGGLVKAGEAFTATIKPVNSAGAVTRNFGCETVAEGVTLAPTVVSPAGGDNGSLANGTIAGGSFCGSATGVTVSNLAWNNVGSLTLAGSVADGDYLGAGAASGAASSALGRFYPDHFSLVGTVSTNSCGFAYMGQPVIDFTATTLEASATDGATTSNYHSGYPVSLAAVSFVAVDAGDATNTDRAGRFSTAPTVSSWSAGVVTLSGGGLSFARGASPDGPYDSLNLGLKVVDASDAAAATGVGPAMTVSGCSAAGNCSARALSTGSPIQVRYGRLKLSNAYGSERLALAIPSVLQYYSGSGWFTNTIDSCTVPGAPTISGSLSPAPSYFSPAQAGLLGLSLAAPNSTGYADIEFPLPDWLKYPWRSSTATAATARATFGIYGGSNKTIFRRERY